MSWAALSFQSIGEVVAALTSRLSDACERITSVGELPGASSVAREIRLLAIPKRERLTESNPEISPELGLLGEVLQLLQKQGAVVPLGENRYRFHHAGGTYQFRLITSTQSGWIASGFQATAGRDLYIAIATAAKNLGLKWTHAAGGFEDLRTGKMKIVTSEKEIFEIARLPFVPPEKRGRWLEFAMKESGLPPIISKDQMRAWAQSVAWTDTTCGGELHQYTFRKAGDDKEFVHVAECIRELGYDGQYLGKKWRYLDLAPYFYFTCGTTLETTSLINRKPLRQPETVWRKNPVPWIPLTQPNVADSRKKVSKQQSMLWDFAAVRSLALPESIT